MSKNILIVKRNNLCVLLREVIGSSQTALSGNLDIIGTFQTACDHPVFEESRVPMQ